MYAMYTKTLGPNFTLEQNPVLFSATRSYNTDGYSRDRINKWWQDTGIGVQQLLLCRRTGHGPVPLHPTCGSESSPNPGNTSPGTLGYLPS